MNIQFPTITPISRPTPSDAGRHDVPHAALYEPFENGPIEESTLTSEINLEEAALSLNALLKPVNTSLQFHRDAATNRIVVEVIDLRSGQQLRQFPDEAILHLAAVLGRLQGQVIDHQA